MMQTTIERLDDNKLRLDVEVPEADFTQAFDSTLAMLGREMSFPGFRPGKVPPKAVLARLGRDAVSEETTRIYLDEWYRSAVVASGIRPVAAPDIEIAEDPKDAAVRFSATVEVVPKPTLPELATLEVDKPNLPDTKKYVDQILEATLAGAGRLADTNSPAKDGDEVVVDFSCLVDGEIVTGAGAVGYQAKIGDGRLLSELEQAILGQEAGSEIEVPVEFPDDHPMVDLAGKAATFQLKIGSVQNIEVPELNDDIAQQVSEFETADELLADIKSSIEERLGNEIEGIFRGNAVAKLAESAQMDIPAPLIQQRQQEMYAGFKQQIEQMGMSIEQYLDRTGREADALLQEMEEGAQDDVRRELVLLALAEQENVVVTEDDIKAEIAQHAEHTGRPIEETTERIMVSGRVDMLRGELLIQRAIDHLVKVVKPKAVDLPTEDEAQEEAELAGSTQE